ncbi:hypothetical protein D8Y20_12010 [Mariprofundus sp. EBB-1]|uniref:hypothetical protein n=1 Tax=Mariprofundus sp. EBB-1 TaxID=2650971 RepID=UPI000EF1F414|nr:hypothetical protein [Mariprofundus sp. EBB-1]RLL50463.1 hypothetical protein D8Y20_12010 [Mariprofundus sp. EBB-1]
MISIIDMINGEKKTYTKIIQLFINYDLLFVERSYQAEVEKRYGSYQRWNDLSKIKNDISDPGAIFRKAKSDFKYAKLHSLPITDDSGKATLRAVDIRVHKKEKDKLMS